MLGVQSGFLSLVIQKNPKVIGTHCVIHREALAARKCHNHLSKHLILLFKVTNYIKASALNTRLFRNLSQDMDAEYDSLLFHASVRWLSKKETC